MKRVPPVMLLVGSMLVFNSTLLSKNLMNETNFTTSYGVNPSLSIAIDSFQHVSCAGGSDGFAFANVSGGVQPYVYLWSNGSNLQMNTPLVAGLYTCTVTDFLGATAEASISINDPPPLTLSTIAQVNIDCINATGSAEVQANGGAQPYSYNWSTGATGSVETGLTTGTYTVTVTDDNGCLAIEVIVIVENLTPPISITIPTLEINCQTPTVTLNGSGSSVGNVAYLWTTTDGNILSGETTLNNCVVDAGGTYTLKVTDLLNGCTATSNCAVTENVTLPTANAGANLQIDCLNPLVTLDGSQSSQGAGFSYLWTTLDGNILSGEATLNNCIVDAAGTYTLEILNIANGCTATDDVSVTVNTTQPNADAGASLHIDCLTPSVALDGSLSSQGAGILYLWTTIDGNIVSGATTINNCVVDAAGTYTLTVTDTGNGCTAIDDVLITEDLTLPIVSAGANLQIDCDNATVTLDGSASSQGGNYNYLWTTNDGNIVSGETTLNSCVVDAAGTYSLEIIDNNNGCTATDDVQVTANLAPPTAEAGASLTIDCLNPTVILNGIGSSVGATISYNWTTVDGNITAGANTLTPTCDQPGTYTLTVTDSANGCTATDDVVVSADLTLPTAQAAANVQIDCNNTTVTLDGSGSSTGVDFEYLWVTLDGSIVSGELTLNNCVVDAPGTYTLTVTSLLNGCTADADAVASSNTNVPAASANVSGQIDCDNATLTLDGSGSAAGTNISYQWTTTLGNIVSGATTLNNCVVDAAGLYTLTVTDSDNGCTNSANVTVAANLSPPTAEAGASLTIDCLNPTVILNGIGSSVGATISYNWTTVDGNITAGANTLTPTCDQAGTYTLTVTDSANGCTATDDVVVNADLTLPTAQAAANVQIDCDNTTVSLDGSGSSTGVDFEYLWVTLDGSIVSGELTLNNCVVDAPGTYTLTVTSLLNGCTADADAVVSSNTNVPAASANVSGQIDCDNATLTLDGSGSALGSNISYQWTTTLGNIVSGATTLNNCEVDAAGLYTLTVTDNDNGCTNSANVTVAANLSPPTAEAGASLTIDCLNPTVILNGIGSSVGATISYNWTTVDGNITAGANTLTPTCDQAGTYTLTVTDSANGCTATDDVVVNADLTLPTAQAAANVQIDCDNTTVSLDGSGSSTGVDFEYLWVTLDGSIVSGELTLNNCVVDAPGTYTLTVTSLLNGCTADADAVVNSNTNVPAASANVSGQIDCDNATLTLDGSGSAAGTNISYQWTTTLGNIVSGATTLNNCVVDAAGLYTLTVTDNDNGCTNSANVTVAANLSPPTAEAGASLTIDCLNPTVILNGIGSSVGATISYNWTTVDGNITAGANTLTPTCDQAGTYTLTVTNSANGCTATDDVVVNADLTLPTAQAAANVQIDCDNTTVSLDGSGSSTGVDFEYLWVTLDGSIVSGELTLNNCVVDAPGTYTLTVTSLLNGCTADADAVVSSNTNVPAASANVSGQIDCDNATLTLDGSGSAAGTNISYQWTTTLGNIVSGANTLNNCVVDAAGLYTLTVTDSDNGCTNSANVTVAANLSPPTAEAGASLTIDCLNPTVILNGIGSSVGATISYNWTTVDGNITAGANTLTPTCDQAGTYTLTVTDSANGCTATDDVVVNADLTLPTAQAAANVQIDCNNTTVTLDGSGSSTGVDFEYLWVTLDGSIVSGELTLNNCVVDAPGTYTLTVTSLLNGCTADADAVVSSNTNVPAASANVSGQIDCDNATLTLDGSGSAAGTNISYQWTTTLGNIVSGANTLNNCVVDAAGLYTLTVTDSDNGCTNSANVTVAANLSPPTAEAGASAQIDCNNATVSLNGAGSSIGANISYLWTTIDGNIVSGANTLTPTCDQPGTYVLEVLDSGNGCTATDDVVVTIDTNLPAANATVNGQIDCNVATLTLDGTGSALGALISYNWTTSNGNILSGANTLNNCVVDAPGLYTLNVTNTATGCSSTAAITVNADLTAPTASASVNGQIDCDNASVTLDGSASSQGANMTYLWTTTDGNISAGANSINATATAGGTYNLLVTDTNNGCTAETNVVVNANLNTPSAVAGGNVTINCIVPTIMLNGAGSSVGTNISYQWTTMDGNISAGANTLTPSVDAGGTYTLEVLDNSNGCTATDDVVVTADMDTPAASAAVNGQIDCINPSLTLDGSGSETGANISYLWTTLDGNIVSGANTLNNCAIDAGGTYNLLVTDLTNGCTAEASVVANSDTNTPTASATVNGQLDCLNASLDLDGSASSQGANISYQWTTVDGNITAGANSQIAACDATGTYVLTVTDSNNGCTATANITVNQDLTNPTAEAGISATLTCALPTTVLNGVGSSLGANIAYLWTSSDGNITAGATTLTPTVGAAGTYTLTVTNNNNGCTASDHVVVNADLDLPTANAAANVNLDCNNATVTLDGIGSSTGPIFSYQWTTINGNIVSGANTLNNCLVDLHGDYTLTVTNTTTGCTATANATVILNNTAPIASAIVNGQIDCDNSTLIIDGSASSQGGNIVYIWTTVNGNIVSGSHNHSPTVDATGTYDLLITDNDNGCTASTSVVVNADLNAPTAEAGVSVQLDCNNATILLNGAGSSVGANISYLWTTTDGNISAGATTLTPTVDAAGTYTLEVSNSSNGCEATDGVVVTIDTNLPAASAAVSGQIDCNNASLTLDGTGSETGAGILYLWTSVNGNIVSGANSLNNCIVDAPGNYTLTVTNTANGCSNSANVNVTADTNAPTASTSVNGQIDCDNVSVGLDGSASSQGANMTYLWITADGNISAGANSMNATADAGGTYTLTVTNTGNGCTATSQVTVISDTNLPIAEAGAGAQLDCSISSAVLNGAGSSTGANISYLWTTTDGNISAGANSLTPTVDAAGTYTLTVSDAGNGCENSDNVVVTISTAVPGAVATVNGNIDCNNASVSLDGTGSETGAGILYLWTTTDGNILSGANTLNNCLVDAAGTYTLTVTNSNNGCTNTANVTVNVNMTLPTASGSVNGQIDCSNASLVIDGSASSQGGNIVYAWTTVNGNIISGSNTHSPAVDAAGIYTLTVTDNGNGCSATINVTVNADLNHPAAEAGLSAQIDCSNLTISLNGTGSSAGANISYLWTTIDGNITAGATTLTPTVNAGGTYTLTVTNDSNGCTDSDNVTVTVSTNVPAASANVNGQLDCLTSMLVLDGTGSEIGTNISYLWTTTNGNIISGASTLNNCMVDASGTYTLTVTNTATGCSASAIVVVTEDMNAPYANASVNGQIDCNNVAITLSGNGSSQGGGILYLWTTTNGNIQSGTNTLNNCVVDAAGTYQLLVTDTNNGCTNSASITVNSDTNLPTASASVNGQIDCDNASVVIDGSASSQGGNIVYAWTTVNGNIISGINTHSPTVDAAGVYSLTVTDNGNGCSATTNVTVNADLNTPTADAGIGAQLDCDNTLAVLNGLGSSIGANISYLWTTFDGNIVSGETTLTPTVNAGGAYTLTVTNNSNGCTASDNVVVTVSTDVPAASASVNGQIDCLTSSLTLDGSGSETGANIIYLWTTLDGNIVSGANTLNNCMVDAGGTYTLTVTNTATGCVGVAGIMVNADTNLPIATANVNGQIDCDNASVVIDGSASSQGANISYLWTTIDGNIVSGANTHSPIVDASGTYTLTVTDGGNGCSANTNVTVYADLNAPTANAGAGVQLDCDQTIAILNGTGSSAGANISYLWITTDGNIVNGATTLTPTVDAGGTYTLTVTNSSNGCTASDNVAVTVSTDVPAASASVNGQIDCLTSSLTLDGSGSETGANITYLWTTLDGNIVSGANTLNNCMVDAGGTYTLTVTNTATGCEGVAGITVNADTNLPTASANVNGQIDCDNASVVIDGSASSQGVNISYLWTTADGNIVSGANTHSPTVDASGTYTLTVTNGANACTAYTSVVVNADLNAPLANAGNIAQLDCFNPTAILNGAGSSIGTNYTYLWTTNDGNIISGETTLMPTVNAAGTYTLTVSNTNNGCTNSDNVQVTEHSDLPAAVAAANGQLDCLNSSLNLSGAGSATGAGIEYLWTTSDGNILSGANTLNNCIVDAPGTYTLTVTIAASGCSNTASATVASNMNLPNASATVNGQIDCTNEIAILDGSASSQGATISYQWTTIDGNIISGANAMIAEADAAGTYTLLVTDNENACTSSTNVIVEENLSTPIANAGQPAQLDCENPSVTLNGTASSQGANFQYQWATIDGNIVSGANTLTPLVNAAGTYILTIIDASNGCSNYDQVQVTQSFDFVLAMASVNGQLDCNNATLTLNGTGSATGANISYLWTTNDGNIVSGANTLNDCVIDAPGTYTLTVSNNANGCSNSADASVSADLEIPEAQATVNGMIGCFNQTVVLDGSGSSVGDCFEYLWTTTDGNIVSGETSITAIADQAGTYTLTVTNMSIGMTAQTTLVVDEIPGIDIELTDQQNIDCFGNANGLASVTGIGGTLPYSYLWSNGATSATISNLPQGTYSVTVTDANGCKNELSLVISQPGDLMVDVNITHESSTNANDGSATLFVSGGTAPYQYQWSNGATTSTINNLAPGNYSVTVLDVNGCSKVIVIIINPHGCNHIDLEIQSQDADCGNPNGGSVTVTAMGGAGGYDFEWSNGATNFVLTGLSAGTYTVTVTDQNGCTAIGTIEIAQTGDNEAPQISLQDITIYLDENGNASFDIDDLVLSVTDDCGDVEIDMDTDFDCDDIGENIVTVTVTDQAGNVTTTEATISVIDNFAPEFVCPEDLVVNSCDGPVYYEIPGLKDNCDDNIDMILIEGLCPGSVFPVGTTQVTYAATDDSGNIMSCTFDVTVQSDLELEVQIQEPTCHDFSDASATVDALNGNIEAYKILWTDPNHQTTAKASSLDPGNYTVLVVDDNNCLVSETVTIPNPPELLVTVDQIQQPTNQNSGGSIYISIVGGKAPYEIEWVLDGDIVIMKEDLKNVPAGNYNCMVTDANGCTFWLDEIILGWEFQDIELGDEGFHTNVFPSPTTGKIFLQIFQEEESPVSVTIFNFIGQQVLHRDAQVIGTADFEFDLTGLPSGQYVVRFNINGKIENKNFVLTSW